jgi:hypothetical protein
MNNQKITGLADPENPQDAATMGYVQTQVANAAAGIDAKESVRLATTANHALTGLTDIDGVTPVAGDRILVKNQTTASANGPYIAAAGAWTRASDANENNELTPGAFWYVEEGTSNGGTQWRIENTGDIVVGTTAITINQFGGAGSAYTAGNGLTLSGNSFSVDADTGISVTASGVAIDTAVVARKFSADVGGAGGPTYTVTHNLNTQDVIVSVRDNATEEVVLADVVANGVNTVTVTFASNPASNAYRVTVLG